MLFSQVPPPEQNIFGAEKRLQRRTEASMSDLLTTNILLEKASVLKFKVS